MSFQEQERALFDLLFDHTRRELFIKDASAALETYDLSDSEKQDFSYIRIDALETDANMRRSMILGQICKSYPLSFSLLSAFDQGIPTLNGLVSSELMKKSTVDRAVGFGQQLFSTLSNISFNTPEQETLYHSIVQAELNMAWSASNLKHSSIEQEEANTQSAKTALSETALPETESNPTWSSQAIRLSPHVSTHVSTHELPISYELLKQQYCQFDDVSLWHHLKKAPQSLSQINELLEVAEPKFLISKAILSHSSACDPVTHHITAELNIGFATLFEQVNGSYSVDEILMEMSHVGANNQLLQQLKEGFKKLLDQGMLELIS